jgi:hypothetical protein
LPRQRLSQPPPCALPCSLEHRDFAARNKCPIDGNGVPGAWSNKGKAWDLKVIDTESQTGWASDEKTTSYNYMPR